MLAGFRARGLMENENILTLRLRLTRRKALFILTAFFLAWHPGFLGSETLTLTTYYPAPYGGYAALLTTGQTLLARDGGVANYINVGAGYNGTGNRRDATVKLEVGDGAISTSAGMRWGVGRGALTADQGGSIELGGSGGFPHVDFSQNMAQDYSARLWLAQAGRLEAVGDFSLTGVIQDACSRVAYTASCPADSDGVVRKQMVGFLPDSSGYVSGFLYKNGAAGVGTYVSMPYTRSGVKVCCRFN